MDFKHEFLMALRQGEQEDALLDLVHRHTAQALPPRDAYHTLQQIWLDYQFNELEAGSRMQDDLEYVMEKIWYECPASP